MKRTRPTSPRSPNWIDKHLADQIRQQRQAINMTQDHLGQELGVTFQQIQKYESGKNRLSAARLYEICQVFGRADRIDVRGPPAQCARAEKERPHGPASKEKAGPWVRCFLIDHSPSWGIRIAAPRRLRLDWRFRLGILANDRTSAGGPPLDTG
jgi:transcriptional regulator with XRE-family HTH domain